MAVVGALGLAGGRRDEPPDSGCNAKRHSLGSLRVAVGLPAPPQAAIVITGTALPEAKSDRVYAVARIGRREIEQAPSHELDQVLKDVPGVQLFRRSDARSGHPTSQGITLRALDSALDFESGTAGGRRRSDRPGDLFAGRRKDVARALSSGAGGPGKDGGRQQESQSGPPRSAAANCP